MMAIKRGPHVAAAIMKKPATVLSILLVAALTMGVALAQRMEQRAQQDRFSFGATIDHTAQ
jgi:hypothetical protein